MVRPQKKKKISEKKEKISLPASRFLANFGIKRGYQQISQTRCGLAHIFQSFENKDVWPNTYFRSLVLQMRSRALTGTDRGFKDIAKKIKTFSKSSRKNI